MSKIKGNVWCISKYYHVISPPDKPSIAKYVYKYNALVVHTELAFPTCIHVTPLSFCITLPSLTQYPVCENRGTFIIIDGHPRLLVYELYHKNLQFHFKHYYLVIFLVN